MDQDELHRTIDTLIPVLGWMTLLGLAVLFGIILIGLALLALGAIVMLFVKLLPLLLLVLLIVIVAKLLRERAGGRGTTSQG